MMDLQIVSIDNNTEIDLEHKYHLNVHKYLKSFIKITFAMITACKLITTLSAHRFIFGQMKRVQCEMF